MAKQSRAYPAHVSFGVAPAEIIQSRSHPCSPSPSTLGNIEPPTSNTQPPINGPIGNHWLFDFGCWVLDVFLRFRGSMREIFGDFSPQPSPPSDPPCSRTVAAGGGDGVASVAALPRCVLFRLCSFAFPLNSGGAFPDPLRPTQHETVACSPGFAGSVRLGLSRAAGSRGRVYHRGRIALVARATSAASGPAAMAADPALAAPTDSPAAALHLCTAGGYL